MAILYRKLYEIKYDFYKIPYEERNKKFSEYFYEKIHQLEFDMETIQDLIDNYLSQRFKKMVYKGEN